MLGIQRNLLQYVVLTQSTGTCLWNPFLNKLFKTAQRNFLNPLCHNVEKWPNIF